MEERKSNILCVDNAKESVYFHDGYVESYAPDTYNPEACIKLFGYDDYYKLANFLEVAKNF